jgi:hypothetical protein
MDSFQKILGKNVADFFIPLVGKLLDSKVRTVYSFTSSDEFKKIQENDIDEANSQYLKEILYRAHFASMSSLAKNLEWIKGMKYSYENGLYLPFASSMVLS